MLVLGIKDGITVEELLTAACNKKQLSVSDHFLRFNKTDSEDFCVPHRQDVVDNLVSMFGFRSLSSRKSILQ